MRPAVKRELPPDSSCGARSSTSTLPACSRADSAAQNAALPPPTTITSYIQSASPSELIAPQAAVDRDDRPGDVAGERRSQKAHQVGDVGRLAVLAYRDVLLAFA